MNEPPERDDMQSTNEPRPQQPSEPVFGRFDASSDTDAFGRDPKKETEFWVEHAKSVLESTEVRQAIEQHAKDGGDGMTDEQRAYMEFIRKLDEEKTDHETEGPTEESTEEPGGKRSEPKDDGEAR